MCRTRYVCKCYLRDPVVCSSLVITLYCKIIVKLWVKYRVILLHMWTNVCIRTLIHMSNKITRPYVYRIVHHLDGWVKRDQLDVTCFIISLYNAQHVSDVNTSIQCNKLHDNSKHQRSSKNSNRFPQWSRERISIVMAQRVTSNIVIDITHEITQHISRKLLRMDVLTSETCWALYKEIIKQVTSSWSLFTQDYTIFYKPEDDPMGSKHVALMLIA